jgi:hypothetical protein
MKYRHRLTGALYEGRGDSGKGLIWFDSRSYPWRSVWTNAQRPTNVLDVNLDLIEDVEPLKQEVESFIATTHDLARSFAEVLPWNLGNVAIALAHNDLLGARAALSAEIVRRYSALEPEGGTHVEVDETRA